MWPRHADLTRKTPARCFISTHMTEGRGPDKKNSRAVLYFQSYDRGARSWQETRAAHVLLSDFSQKITQSHRENKRNLAKTLYYHFFRNSSCPRLFIKVILSKSNRHTLDVWRACMSLCRNRMSFCRNLPPRPICASLNRCLSSSNSSHGGFQVKSKFHSRVLLVRSAYLAYMTENNTPPATSFWFVRELLTVKLIFLFRCSQLDPIDTSHTVSLL